MNSQRAFIYGFSALVALSHPVWALEPVGGRTIAGGAIGGGSPGTFTGGFVPLFRTNGVIKAACLTAEFISGSTKFFFVKDRGVKGTSVDEGFEVRSTSPSGASCSKGFDYAAFSCIEGPCQFMWRVDATK